jgi:hypothetical protein
MNAQKEIISLSPILRNSPNVDENFSLLLKESRLTLSELRNLLVVEDTTILLSNIRLFELIYLYSFSNWESILDKFIEQIMRRMASGRGLPITIENFHSTPALYKKYILENSCLLNDGISRPRCKSIESAVSASHYSCLSMYLRSSSAVLDPEIFAVSIEGGRATTKILRCILNHLNIPMSHRKKSLIFNLAVRAGNLEVIEWLQGEGFTGNSRIFDFLPEDPKVRSWLISNNYIKTS